jgi:hypothetical protein
MPLEELTIWVYCWVDENYIEILGENNIRKRVFEPALSDIEVITMEIVGEFISFDTDKGSWEYFKRVKKSQNLKADLILSGVNYPYHHLNKTLWI